MPVKSELQDYFGELAPDVETEAESICRLFNLSGEDLFFKWEAFSMSSLGATQNQSTSTLKAVAAPVFNLANARELRKEIQATFRPKHPKMELDATPGPSRGATQRKSVGKTGLNSLLDGIATPTIKKKASLNAGHSPLSASKLSPKLSPTLSTDYVDDFTTPSKKATQPIRPPSSPIPLDAESDNRLFRPSTWSAPRASTFETRTTPDKPLESLNGHLDPAKPLSGVNARVKLSTTLKPGAYDYRYMFEKLSDRGNASDQRIEDCAEIMRQAYELEEEFGDPSVDSQEDSICVGRICTDIHATRLQDPSDRNKTSIWLESSRLMGSGSRIELRFDDQVKIHGLVPSDGGAGLFPGAIVGVKGRNVGSQYFNVSEIYPMPPLYAPDSSPRALLNYQHSQELLGGRPMSVIAACGPFTTDDNLDFAPLDALMEVCRKTQPDIVILIGPFIDVNHPAIKFGDVDQTPQQIFRENISSRLAHLLQSSTATTAILIPSLQDVLSLHAAFPQSPLAKDPEFGLPKKAKLLPNPATFSINEVVFLITAVDVLFPIRQLEYLREGIAADEASAMDSDEPKDAIGRACRHILRQRSVYPLFPAPLPGAGIEAVNLDITHSKLLEVTPTGVDVVILPSRLGNHFVKTVDGAVIVNPAKLTQQGTSAGTYAHLTIHPIPKNELNQEIAKANMAAEEHTVDHKVHERARVDIWRI